MNGAESRVRMLVANDVDICFTNVRRCLVEIVL